MRCEGTVKSAPRAPENRESRFHKSLTRKELQRSAEDAGILPLNYARSLAAGPIVTQNLISSDSIRFLLSAVLKCVYRFVVF